MQVNDRLQSDESKTGNINFNPKETGYSLEKMILQMQQEIQRLGMKVEFNEKTFEHNAKVLFKNGHFGRADGCFQSAFNLSEDSDKKIYYLFMRGLCYSKSKTPNSDQDAIRVFGETAGEQSKQNKWASMAAGLKILVENRDSNSNQRIKIKNNSLSKIGKTIAPEYWGCTLTDSQRDKAVKSFQNAVKIDPDCSLGWEYLAALKMSIDSGPAMKEAIDALRNLVRTIPEHEKRREFLAVQLAKLENKSHLQNSSETDF